MPASLSFPGRKTFVGLAAAGLISVAAMVPAFGASPTAKPTISAEASAALAHMAQSLLSKQFSFQARTMRVYADVDGRFLHIGHTLKVLVRRPDRLRVDIDGDDGATQVFYDGKTLTLFSPTRKEYVSLSVPDTIENMIKEAEKRVGFDFPLEDFLSQTPDHSLLSGVTEGKIVNQVTIDGAPANHLTLFQPPGLELELWLRSDERTLPKRLFITYRSIPGQPNFIAEFSDWNLSATPNDADFTFQPPEGAKQVELKSAAAPPPSSRSRAFWRSLPRRPSPGAVEAEAAFIMVPSAALPSGDQAATGLRKVRAAARPPAMAMVVGTPLAFVVERHREAMGAGRRMAPMAAPRPEAAGHGPQPIVTARRPTAVPHIMVVPTTAVPPILTAQSPPG